MKPKTQEALSHALNQVCGKIRQIVPQAVESVGEDFTGKVTVEVTLNSGGIPAKPRVTFSF